MLHDITCIPRPMLFSNMRWIAVATVLAFLTTVRAQVTVCLATYGGFPTSVPPPGREFLIQVIPKDVPIARRQDGAPGSGFLDSTGQIQSECQQGSIFRLVSGSLFSGSGQISASEGLPSARFGIIDHLESIATVFAVAQDETLYWNNDAFDDGSVRFGATSNGVVNAVFSGPLSSDYISVSLKVLNTINCPNFRSASSAPLGVSTSASPAVATMQGNSSVLSTIPPYTTQSSKSTSLVSSTSTRPSTLTTTTPSLSPSRSSSSSSLYSSPTTTSKSSLASSTSTPTSSIKSSTAMSSSIVTSTTPRSSTASSSPLISVPAYSIPLQSRDAASISSASSIISESSYTDFCDTLLGQTTSEVTTVISVATTVSEMATTRPTDNLITSFVTVTIFKTVIVPSGSVTVVETIGSGAALVATTATAIATGPAALKVRQFANNTGLVTPTPLQPFEPTILSTACSSIIQSATVITLTTTVTSTIYQTAWKTEPYGTIESTVDVAATTTVADGIATAFETTSLSTSTSSKTSSAFSSTSASQSSSVARSSSASSSLSISGRPNTRPPTTNSATQSTNICSPSIVLASPTALVGSVSGSPESYDDKNYKLTLPFEMQIFDRRSADIFVSTNGILSLDNGTNEFTNYCLPTAGPDAEQPAYVVPEYAAFPFWDDTYVYQGDPQGIYYEYGSRGDEPIAVAFEYYLSHYFNDTQYYHYTVFYDVAKPGQFIFKYYQVSDNGYSATVGIQNNNALSPGAPFGLQYFCQLCNDSPNTQDPTNIRPAPPPEQCVPGIIVPGLELVVKTYPNNTGTIEERKFSNCLQAIDLQGDTP